MRPLDYDNQHKDGLYVRCVCGLPWSAHPLFDEVVDPETHEVLNPDRCRRYRPMIGHFGQSKNKPIQTYTEVFGYQADDAGKRFVKKYDEEVFRTEHTHTIARNVLNRIAAHGARDFPRECCGFILGDKVEDVRPIVNTNKLGYGSYTMHVGQQLAVLKEVENGKQLKVVYHSHPNMGAFFSSIDRNAASSIDPEQPDWPETVWIVMSIRALGTSKWVRGCGEHCNHHDHRKPHLADARAYLWNPAIKDFSEITLKVVE
jgi:proteasome lid subunit RPN8/RPN11